ncbi:MAG: FAD/NAD(P)-binding protein [Verrucomicrobia bacterium]|nr:FAD/NAD(P)-binding protein [Verrucomicrobiota bacterium]
MKFTPSLPRVVIVGGGVSGTLVAAQLLRRARHPLHVQLIERTGAAGPGVAYGTRCQDHLLNVPVSRMSALPEEPEHFLQWLTARAGRPGFPGLVSPRDYVARHLYGLYVREVLSAACGTAAAGTVLEQIAGEVVDLEESGEELVVRFADGRALLADRVVLAIGNLPGEYPIPRPLPFYQTPRYIHVPWRGDALDGLAPDDEVLLVGQGLTATDLIVQLARQGHRGTIHALSRHGIRPQAHRSEAGTRAIADWEDVPPTIRAWTRRVIDEIRAATEEGEDWRGVVDGMRPYTQAIWQSLSWDERARFLRHVRPLWEAHRHRVAPATAAFVDQLAAEGKVKFYAGRLQVLEADDRGVHAMLRRRGTIQHVSLRVAKVINCTGPRTDYTKYQHPLLVHLLARGLIDHDPLALGINALPTGEVLRYRGAPLERVFTLGAPLKGVLWESSAVREIRVQAADLAERLIASVAAVAPAENRV